MRCRMLVCGLLAIGLLGIMGTNVMAQGGPPPPDTEPGAQGISFIVLSAIDPVAAEGQSMEMREYTWEPGSYATPHTHPAAAALACVEVGTIGFSIQSGAAVVTRAVDEAGTPPEAEPVAIGDELILEPGDCFAMDEAADSTTHTVWNAGDETAVTIETYLFDREEPGRIFVDDQGTPIPS